MERPHHLQTANQSLSSRLLGMGATAAILFLAIGGLVTALATGAIIKQMQEIKASVEREKTPPKPPPPPPVDMVQPPPPTAIVPQFTTTVEAPPPPVTTAPKPPPPPPRVAVAPTTLAPIMRTHTQPPYPTISQRLGEQGKSEIIVNINEQGNVTDCKVEKGSGSDRLDTAACEYVKAHWRWNPPTQEGKPVSASTRVSVIWNLKDAQ